MNTEEELIYRLRKRAEIRRNIPHRKSVQENQPDRIAELLDEAADEIESLKAMLDLNYRLALQKLETKDSYIRYLQKRLSDYDIGYQKEICRDKTN